MIRNKYLAYALFILFFILFWSILQYLFNRETYQLTVNNLIIPLVTGIIVGYFAFLNGHGN